LQDWRLLLQQRGSRLQRSWKQRAQLLLTHLFG
jgi:hypothetical protein